MNQAPHEGIKENKDKELQQLTLRLEILNIRQQDLRRQSFEVQQRIQKIQQE